MQPQSRPDRWRTIRDFPTHEINYYSQIRNKKTQRILKPYIRHDGYETITLYKDGRKYCRSVVNLRKQEFGF